MPYTFEYLVKVCQWNTTWEMAGGTYRMGGAQLAMTTFFAPTSLAICMISFDVVPRTIESRSKMRRCRIVEMTEYLPSTSSTFLPENSNAIALSFRRTFFFLKTTIQSLVQIKSTLSGLPHLLPGHDEGSTNISILHEPFSVRKVELLSQIQRSHSGGVRNLCNRTSDSKPMRTYGAGLAGMTTSTEMFRSVRTRWTSSARASPMAIRLR